MNISPVLFSGRSNRHRKAEAGDSGAVETRFRVALPNLTNGEVDILMTSFRKIQKHNGLNGPDQIAAAGVLKRHGIIANAISAVNAIGLGRKFSK